MQPGGQKEQRQENWLADGNEAEPEQPKTRGGILGRIFGGKRAEARA